ncbi:hypothetical protein D3C73_752340 [compost metagenome]
MIEVVWTQVVAMATSEARIFLEYAFLDVKAKSLGLAVFVVWRDFGDREPVDLTILEKDLVEGLAFIVRVLVENVLRPDFLGGEALGELNQLPEVGAGFARRVYQLVPYMGAAFGIAVSTFLLHPHRSGQDKIGT